jgi:hypothetical protein
MHFYLHKNFILVKSGCYIDGGSVKLSVIGWGLRLIVAATCREGGGGAVPWLGQ